MKKLTLNKESILLLSESKVEDIHVGTSTNWCWAVTSYVTGKIVDKFIDAWSNPCGQLPYSEAGTCTNNRLCWG